MISSETWGGIRKLPHVFTEHGVTMLSTLLRSDTAIKVSLVVIRAFVAMRHYLADNAVVFQRLDRIELKQIDTDNKVNQIFKQLEQPKADKAVIFYNGQMWDAVKAIEDIIAKAEEEVILIDNYVDRRTLDLLSKKGKDVKLYIYINGW